MIQDAYRQIVEQWISERGHEIPGDVRHSIERLCHYTRSFDSEIKTHANEMNTLNFTLKNTDQKIDSINYDTREFTLK